MKILKKYNQHRRDCHVDLECENCGNKETNEDGYDDRNYWDNVIPNQKCKGCEKSTKDLGGETEQISTKYPDGFNV